MEGSADLQRPVEDDFAHDQSTFTGRPIESRERTGEVQHEHTNNSWHCQKSLIRSFLALDPPIAGPPHDADLDRWRFSRGRGAGIAEIPTGVQRSSPSF